MNGLNRVHLDVLHRKVRHVAADGLGFQGDEVAAAAVDAEYS